MITTALIVVFIIATTFLLACAAAWLAKRLGSAAKNERDRPANESSSRHGPGLQ
jgi:hypothetical protein